MRFRNRLDHSLLKRFVKKHVIVNKIYVQLKKLLKIKGFFYLHEIQDLIDRPVATTEYGILDILEIVKLRFGLDLHSSGPLRYSGVILLAVSSILKKK